MKLQELKGSKTSARLYLDAIAELSSPSGMNLRDYFAAAVLPELFQAVGKTYDERADIAYRQADAMIERRKYK